MSFFRSIFRSVSHQNSLAGAYDEEPTVTVSGNVHVQPSVTVSGNVHTTVQPTMTVSASTNNGYSTVSTQPSVGLSVGVSAQPTVHVQPTVGMTVSNGYSTMNAQPTIGMTMNTTTYESNYNTVTMQPTVDMSIGVQPTVGVNMNMGMPGVGIGFNMGMPNMTVSTHTTSTSTYTPPPQNNYTPPPVTNYSSGGLAQKIIAACKNSTFDSDKVKAVVSYSSAECSPIMAMDLVTILKLFDFANDQVKVINQLKSTNNIAQMSCNDAVSILNVLDMDNDKIKVLDVICSQIYDRRQSAETIVGTFSFSNDQDKARKMLLR
ncbi:predicted protein [Naegleria gruberi]|uniref:Predicted protein n=1 Tax=Naegleria gruberi TaxID=5762 RepID=D2VTB4_NAEGR|nr:uncharacterized protein NAEGRDRAFT_72240 [Naegleria gruberi]EFC39903.1 predicted protein [Naegleria gruberi]|eukprot:XP_002672647.1 predicted protein [Naegleria gruberi strain NEG-M]